MLNFLKILWIDIEELETLLMMLTLSSIFLVQVRRESFNDEMQEGRPKRVCFNFHTSLAKLVY